MWALFAVLAVAGAPRTDDAEDQYRYLAGLAERELHDLVVAEAGAFLEAHPGHRRAPEARFRLGESLFALDRFAEASSEFRRLDRLPDFGFALEVDFRRGQCALELGRPDAAEPAFEAVLAAGGGYLRVPATFLSGEARLRSGEFGRAAARFEQVLAVEPDGEFADDAAHGLVWCARAAGDPATAVERGRAFLSRWPEDARAPEVWMLRAESELELGRFDAALASYARVGEGQHAPGALRGRAFALAGLGRHAEAALAHDDLLARHAGSEFAGESALHRGIERLRADDVAGALEALADPRVPSGPEADQWRARALLGAGRAEEALDAADRGLAAGPASETRTQLLLARGDALFALGREGEAARVFEAAGDDYARHAAAVSLLRAGDATGALELASALVREGGEYAEAAARVEAEALFTLGDWLPAASRFDALAANEADAAERAALLLRAGWARFELGTPEPAAASFLGALAAAREAREGALVAEATFMVARASETLGRDDDARAAYERVLALDSDHGYGSEALVRLARMTAGPTGEQYLERAVRGGGAFASRARFELAERRSERGALEAAGDDYRALLAEDANAFGGAASYGLAWCELGLGSARAAADRLDGLSRREDLEPTLEVSVLELLVWAAREARLPDLARSAATRLAGAGVTDARVLEAARTAAATLVAADRRDEARALVAATTERLSDPEVRSAATVEEAWLALDGGDLEGAERLLARARRESPASKALAEATFFVGEARFARGEDGAACAHYAAATPHAAGDLVPNVLYKWGFADLRRGEPAAASQRFADLVGAYPEHALVGESLFLWGEALHRAGRTSEALGPLERVVEGHPRHAVRAKALFRLGLTAHDLGRHARAVEVLGELAREHPGFEARAEGELVRGRALTALDRGREARAALGRALEWDGAAGAPTVISARVRLALGRLSVAEGDLDGGLSEFLKVAVLFAQAEEVAEALFLAGDVLATQGRVEQARARWDEARSRFPKSEYGERAAARLQN